MLVSWIARAGHAARYVAYEVLVAADALRVEVAVANSVGYKLVGAAFSACRETGTLGSGDDGKGQCEQSGRDLHGWDAVARSSLSRWQNGEAT